LTDLVPGTDVVMALIPTWKRPEKRKRTPLDEILLLDAMTEPGLPQFKFTRLFAKCGCGWITTRRAFENHVCAANHPVIDLTDGNDSIDDVIDLMINEDL
jgi:hypothetical protein